jgi:ubiquinone/menaquinone biosynthesis C-methylase UbiE
MPDSHLNYDPIATTYDRRYAVNDMKNTLLALQALARSIEVQSVLEVGCGTGHWLAALSPNVNQLYGLDLSAGMLSHARQRGLNLKLMLGQAGCLPCSAASMDMIFTLNAIHHFPDKQAFIAEAFRLLLPAGVLAVIGSVLPTQVDDWYIYRYFPGTYERDVARFPTRQALLDWMTQAGFIHFENLTLEHFANQYPGRAVLDDPFLPKNSTSQLALLSDQAYAQGIQRIEHDIEAAEQAGEQILFSSSIYLHMVTGWKK